MRILINEKLSAHKFRTPEGYLICQDAVLARTGPQTYRKNEIFLDSDSDEEIQVDRKPEQVFAPETLASFENKPITVEHPEEDVTVDNYKDYAVGFVRDVRQGKDGDNDVILGNLVITDKDTIDEILDGQHTELSCGYDCDITDDDNPQQIRIRGNHLALCERGRAGIARIVDSVNDDKISDSLSQEIGGFWSGLAKKNKMNNSDMDKIYKEFLKTPIYQNWENKNNMDIIYSQVMFEAFMNFFKMKTGRKLITDAKVNDSEFDEYFDFLYLNTKYDKDKLLSIARDYYNKGLSKYDALEKIKKEVLKDSIKDSQPQKIFKVNDTFIVAKDRYEAIKKYKNEQRNDR